MSGTAGTAVVRDICGLLLAGLIRPKAAVWATAGAGGAGRRWRPCLWWRHRGGTHAGATGAVVADKAAMVLGGAMGD